MKIAKILAGLLVIVLLLAGCEQTGGTLTSSPPASPGANSGTTADRGAVLYTIGDKSFYEDDFRFWVIRALEYAQVSAEGEIDWNESDGSGMTLADFVKNEAVQSSKVFKVVEDKAKELGLPLTAEEKDYLDNIRANVLTQYFDNDLEMLEQYLNDYAMTDEMLRYQEEIPILYNKIIDEIIGPGGEKISDGDILAWGAENGVVRAKHILFKTKSDDRITPLSEDLIAFAKETADNLYAELSEISDRAQLLSTYDIKMQDMSEDPGKISNPDGYQFMPGSMREAFTATVQGLDEYEISPPVDIEDGYSIMLRLPLDPNMTVIDSSGGAAILREMVAGIQMNDLIDAWTNEMSVEFTDAFNNIDLNKLLGK
ncbi:MAG: peptidylprolyl isomerase [Oscillospiraceae bacterium]|jgi:hypothetical protein|nr:peptidylprolyl isomerase [Oscillospiraceae bacterium]